MEQNLVNSNTDFWQDAQDFLTTQLPKDFEGKMKEHIIAKNYTQNDFRLFKHMLQEAVGYHATVLLIKHFQIK